LRKKIKETTVVEQIVITCDVCGGQAGVGITGEVFTKVCSVCGKDLCDKCYIRYGDYYGDSRPPIYCSECLEFGKPYMEEIKKLEMECETKIESLEKEWVDKCKERRDNRKKFIPEFQDCSNH
jgi:hypothetical protein